MVVSLDPLHLIITMIKWIRTRGERLERKPAQFSISEQLLHRNVKRFQGGLVFKAHRWLHHSTLGSRVIKKKRRNVLEVSPQRLEREPAPRGGHRGTSLIRKRGGYRGTSLI